MSPTLKISAELNQIYSDVLKTIFILSSANRFVNIMGRWCKIFVTRFSYAVIEICPLNGAALYFRELFRQTEVLTDALSYDISLGAFAATWLIAREDYINITLPPFCSAVPLALRFPLATSAAVLSGFVLLLFTLAVVSAVGAAVGRLRPKYPFLNSTSWRGVVILVYSSEI
jgi:hypothetical protein